VGLDACARANRDPALDFDKGADKHAIAQCATIEVDGFNQCDVFTELNVDDAVLVDSGLAHGDGGVNLSLEWVGCIILKARRGKPGLMSGDGVEIEYRFFVPDHAVLPALGRGSKMIQCYLPKWKILIENNHLCLEERILVRDLPMDVIRQLSDLIEGANITPRVRLVGDAAFVTVKGPMVDYSRAEWEFEVMVDDVRDLVTSFRFPHVMKTRYEVPSAEGLCWEIDVFEGDNHGLVMAELEVPSADFEFVRPEWLGSDVTSDDRFGNGSLARDPWCDWCDDV
jgi:CYTH domain-containing protein